MRTVITILCFLSLPSLAQTGHSATLLEKVHKVLLQESSWKIHNTIKSPTEDPIKEEIELRRGRIQAAISISIWRNSAEAEEDFKGDAEVFDNIVGKKKLKRTLPGLGDENFIWTNPKSTAWPMIHFRQDNVRVLVYAPSVAVAQRFAKLISKTVAED